MKKIILWALLVFIGGVSAFAAAINAEDLWAGKNGPNSIIIQTHDGSKFLFNVELATTGEQQSKGLMDRSSMQDNAGMLFVFDSVDRRSFWMKDTLIPLDMLFLAEDGEIRHIHHMAKPLDETRVTSEEPFKAVLEINGGLAAKLGFRKGDKVLHEAFRNTLAQ